MIVVLLSVISYPIIIVDHVVHSYKYTTIISSQKYFKRFNEVT